MKITQFTDYSLRLMLYLAGQPERVVSVREVSEFYGISSEHLKKIVRRLIELGYLGSVRGKHGGLRLLREPGAINLGQLMREEENLALLPCRDAAQPCPVNGCKLSGIVDDALAAFLGVLDRKTLADLI